MFEFPIKLLLVARTKPKSRARLEAENMVLRQQGDRTEPQDSFAGAAEKHRRADLCLDVPTVPLDPERNHLGQTRDFDPVA
jgi:hypothetical protein